MQVLQVEPIGGHRGMHYYDLQLCNALVEQGVQPVLLTSDETKGMGLQRFPVAHMFRGIFGEEHAIRRGVRYLWALLCIAARPRGRDRAVIHLHFFLVPLLDYLFVRLVKLRGYRVVMTAHDVVPLDQGATQLLGKIYHLADRIIVHAQSNRDELAETFGVSAERVAIIPHGNYAGHISGMLGETEAKERLGLTLDREVVLFFGQIKRVKGLDYLLKAFPLILRNHPAAVLVIAGAVWKDDWSRYQTIIDKEGVADHVISRIQHIPDEDVPLYFGAADVVALPYLRIYQSGVLLMAFSYGRPVVATATGGMTEVLQHGETGYLVPPRDSAALADAISRVLGDKAAAQRMGDAARQLAEREYAWSDIAAKTRQVYEQALGQA